MSPPGTSGGGARGGNPGTPTAVVASSHADENESTSR